MAILMPLMIKNIYIDIETTGIDINKNGIVQIYGCIEIDNMIKEKFDFRIKPFPGEKINEKALEVNKLSKYILENDPRFKNPLDVYKELIEIFSSYVDKYNKEDKFNFIGYNSNAFDYPFLRSWFVKCGDNYFGSWFWNPTIDVMLIWAFIYSKSRSELDNFKLPTLAKHIGIDIDDSKLHDSAYDVLITRELYIRAKDYLKIN